MYQEQFSPLTSHLILSWNDLPPRPSRSEHSHHVSCSLLFALLQMPGVSLLAEPAVRACGRGWEDAAKGFREIPVGMSARKIWVNPAVRSWLSSARLPSSVLLGVTVVSVSLGYARLISTPLGLPRVPLSPHAHPPQSSAMVALNRFPSLASLHRSTRSTLRSPWPRPSAAASWSSTLWATLTSTPPRADARYVAPSQRHSLREMRTRKESTHSKEEALLVHACEVALARVSHSQPLPRPLS